MNQTKISPKDLELIPELELMVVLVPDDGGNSQPLQARSDLADVLDGDRQPPEVWDDGSELEEFLAEEGAQRRWMPRALAAVGVLAVVAGVLVVTVGQSSEAAERVAVLPEILEPSLQRTPPPDPAPAQPVLQQDPSSAEENGPSATHRRRGPQSRKGARSKEDLRRQVLELMGVDGEAAPAVKEPPAPRMIPAKNTNTPMFLASRIYRRNKRTLLTCDRLAQRRGESLANSRAVFRIDVDGQGVRSAKVAGKGVEDRRLACYRVMASRWHLPRTRDGYSTSFQHIN